MCGIDICNSVLNSCLVRAKSLCFTLDQHIQVTHYILYFWQDPIISAVSGRLLIQLIVLPHADFISMYNVFIV